jgi:CRISPR-associated protein (TIGR02584 family)
MEPMNADVGNFIGTSAGAPGFQADWAGQVRPPHAFAKRTLLAVTGLSPQVVTETLYALCCQSNPPFVPTEIHVITTAEGAERLRLTLLSDEPGWFHRLRRDYGLPEIKFDDDTIHVLTGPAGDLLPDIRTREENQAVADIVLQVIRRLTGDDESAVHVSLAGGRKTMGFYAGYALCLMGRPQDRLSHVLVSPPYESNPQFFYPTPYRHVIFTPPPDSRPLDAARAEVVLAEIPFASLRYGLDERLLKGTTTFGEVVSAARRLLDPPSMEFDLDARAVVLGGQELKLPPVQLAFLSWLARRTVEGKPPVHCPADGAPEAEFAREYLREYAHLADDLDGVTPRRLREGMDKAFFVETKSKLHRSLRNRFGLEAVYRYGVLGTGGRPLQYRLAVPGSRIRWLGGI